MPVTTAESAVRLINSGDRVFVHGGSAVPAVLLSALVDRSADLDNVELVHLHLNGDGAAATMHARHLRHRALFVDASTRDAVATGAATYIPAFLSDVPALFSGGRLPLDVALLHVSPPDTHGFCSLGVSVDCALAAARAARLRIAQTNPRMPRTHGDAFLHVSELDAVVEVDEPLPEAESTTPSAVHHAIAALAAELIEDGATLQLGIGAIPNAVAAALHDRRDLGIHSEVISDGVMDLIARGVVTGSRKTINRGKVVVAFLNGSRRLFEFADDNPMVEMRPVDYTNDTRVILRLDNMVAVNSAIQMDLTGQVCAESIGTRMYSGVGGQMDFLRGAALSRGGHPIIALASTARGGAISRIVPTLDAGAAVTTTRAHVNWVVTEHGRVNLHGLDIAERARALIGIAAPAFRDDLARSGHQLGLLASI
ncbi:MAG TPA: acetyl-CoA hydrolase/transferase C-terminal domain-containing protein [Candidatus Deferrimicrobium sp.]|nr:acetyl-CoA hydrolase/transferase C-terminal domain-containing protein [Candidatus Deferrimicrobium sp.]